MPFRKSDVSAIRSASDFQESRGRLAEDPAAKGLDNDILLDSNSSSPGKIHAGLDRDHISRGQRPFLESVHSGGLVDLEPESVSRAVAEPVGESEISQVVTSRSIDRGSRNPL